MAQINMILVISAKAEIHLHLLKIENVWAVNLLPIFFLQSPPLGEDLGGFRT
jgi:hypothetical protein